MQPHVIPGHDPESVKHTVMLFATDPETIFVASACEYGVAVLGDVSMVASIMVTGTRQNTAPRHSGLDPESVQHTAVTFTDPETIFVASACEYGVAVQDDVSMVASIMTAGTRQNTAPRHSGPRPGICKTYAMSFTDPEASSG